MMGARPEGRVLHVSLAHGGGVVSAIDSYVNNSVAFEHHLLASLPTSVFEDDIKFDGFASVRIVNGISRFIRDYRDVVYKINPDIIHLHSSFAGALGRAVLWGRNKVYTPHCYSFERLDVNWVLRGLFFYLEKALSISKCRVVACGPTEKELALRLGYSEENVISAYNYSDARPSVLTNKDSGVYTVAMCGRICNQKDPAFFAETAKLFMARYSVPVAFVWYGDGDHDLRVVLEENGVEVSGWMPREELLGKLSAVDLYFHSALWEGNSMAILEAASLRLPILARNIRSTRALGISSLCDSAADAAHKIEAFLSARCLAAAQEYEKINTLCSQENLQRGLERAYTLPTY